MDKCDTAWALKYAKDLGRAKSRDTPIEFVPLSSTIRVPFLFRVGSRGSDYFRIADKPATASYFAFLDGVSGHQGDLFIQVLRT